MSESASDSSSSKVDAKVRCSRIADEKLEGTWAENDELLTGTVCGIGRGLGLRPEPVRGFAQGDTPEPAPPARLPGMWWTWDGEFRLPWPSL